MKSGSDELQALLNVDALREPRYKNPSLVEIIDIISRGESPESIYIGKGYTKADLIRDLIRVRDTRVPPSSRGTT